MNLCPERIFYHCIFLKGEVRKSVAQGLFHSESVFRSVWEPVGSRNNEVVIRKIVHQKKSF